MKDVRGQRRLQTAEQAWAMHFCLVGRLRLCSEESSRLDLFKQTAECSLLVSVLYWREQIYQFVPGAPDFF